MPAHNVSNLPKENIEDFKPVSHRKKRKPPIVGQAKTNLAIKGSEKLVHYHVRGLDPDTTEVNLREYLSSLHVDRVSCSKLIARRPHEYSSFRVSCKADNRSIIEDSDNWPDGAKINHFLFHLERRKEKKKELQV